MWLYLLLGAGLFMGWSLGSVDSASAFGTAVATRVIRYRTAVIIIAIMVLLGALIGGEGNIGKLHELATSNEVLASKGDVAAAIENGAAEQLRLHSALKACIIFVCAALTVFLMNCLRLPVSSNQAIIGAIIGWGLCHADYADPQIFALNLSQMGKFACTWVLNPVAAGIVSFILVWLFNKFFENRLSDLSSYDRWIKMGYFGAGIFAAYSIGVNSSASVTALYYDAFFEQTGVATNLLSSTTLTVMIGAVAIAVGALTYSRRCMMTVGSSIAQITQTDGFLVVIAMAITVIVMGRVLGIPVSNSQAVVGAVIGAGLTRGVKNVNFGVFKNIAIAWISSPTVAGLLTYLVALATKNFFA